MAVYFLVFFLISTSSVISGPLVHNANSSVADSLAKKVRVLCAVIMTTGESTRVQYIEDTWGSNCNKVKFLSKNDDPSNNRNVNLDEDQLHCRFMYEQYNNEFDWFLVTNEESFIIVENLRYMLADYKTTDPIYFIPDFYSDRGVKYILSRKALDSFVNADFQSIPACFSKAYNRANMINCLTDIGMRAVDSRDYFLRDRFLPQNPYQRLSKRGHRKFWNCAYPHKELDCFSDFAISFDEVDLSLMHLMYYLIYELRPYGVNLGNFLLPKILLEDKRPKRNKGHNTNLYDREDSDDNENYGLAIPVDTSLLKNNRKHGDNKGKRISDEHSKERVKTGKVDESVVHDEDDNNFKNYGLSIPDSDQGVVNEDNDYELLEPVRGPVQHNKDYTQNIGRASKNKSQNFFFGF